MADNTRLFEVAEELGLITAGTYEEQAFAISQISIYDLGKFCDEISRKDRYYPKKSDFTTWNVYRKGEVLARGLNHDQLLAHTVQAIGAIAEPCVDDAKYAEAVELYRSYSRMIEELFLGGLFYLTDTLDNPKATKAYSIAYERGHSSGYQEVAGNYDALLELIKD